MKQGSERILQESMKQTPEILRRQNPRHSDGWDGISGEMSRMMSKSLTLKYSEVKTLKRQFWR